MAQIDHPVGPHFVAAIERHASVAQAYDPFSYPETHTELSDKLIEKRIP